MKQLLLAILLIASCAKKQEVEPPLEDITLLERPKMEYVVHNMASILAFAKEFQKDPKNQELPELEYNTKLYQAMFDNQYLMQGFVAIGFENVQQFQEFYDTMIQTYILITENPGYVQAAIDSLPEYEKDLPKLAIKAGQEPNNQKLQQQYKRMNYEYTAYKNLVLVNSFLGQLNAFNAQQ